MSASVDRPDTITTPSSTAVEPAAVVRQRLQFNYAYANRQTVLAQCAKEWGFGVTGGTSAALVKG